MRSKVRYLISILAMLAVVLAAVPSGALAGTRGERPPRRPERRLGVTGLRATAFAPVQTYATDAFDKADDTPAGARDLSAKFSGSSPAFGFGVQPFQEAHTFWIASHDTVPGAGDAQADQDWFRFSVTQFDVDMGKPYLIEARPGNLFVDPVIELYGPTTGTVTPGDPRASVDASGHGLIDPAALEGEDYSPWVAGGGFASLEFIPDEPGTYFCRVRPWFWLNVVQNWAGYADGAGPYTMRLKVGRLTRLSGTDRVLTAIEASKERVMDGELPYADYSDSGGTVVVANGWNFPDALAGSALAGAVNGPLLLTHSTYLDPSVSTEIRRLDAHRVYILGGTGAVSAKVQSDLGKVVGSANVIRVAGPAGTGRVETAVEIARETADQMPDSFATTAFIVNGWSYADALSASPMAAWNYAAVLLTRKDSLPEPTEDVLAELGITDVVIVGGTGAVGSAVEARLKTVLNADGMQHVKRIGGNDRYETSVKFAKWATGDHGLLTDVGTDADPTALWALMPSRFAIAAGWKYSDALGGGVFAGEAGYPLLLTPRGPQVTPWILPLQGEKPASSTYASIGSSDINYIGSMGRSYAIGGPSVVDPSVVKTLDSLMGNPPTD